jgi:hypothetical protein
MCRNLNYACNEYVKVGKCTDSNKGLYYKNPMLNLPVDTNCGSQLNRALPPLRIEKCTMLFYNNVCKTEYKGECTEANKSDLEKNPIVLDRKVQCEKEKEKQKKEEEDKKKQEEEDKKNKKKADNSDIASGNKTKENKKDADKDKESDDNYYGPPKFQPQQVSQAPSMGMQWGALGQMGSYYSQNPLMSGAFNPMSYYLYSRMNPNAGMYYPMTNMYPMMNMSPMMNMYPMMNMNPSNFNNYNSSFFK